MTIKNLVNGLLTFTVLGCSLLIAGISVASADQASIAEGKKIAFDRKKGNCLACHMIADGALPGNIGPPLIAMKARFPSKANLRAQIWNASIKNPNTIMPPFGKHKILNDGEIDKITDFIHSL
jgi:sulfur-oxidizing protein SoxX